MHKLGVPLEEMYRVFNMGIGFVVIIKSEDAKKAINIIKKYNLAFEIGTTTDDIQEKVSIKTFKNDFITL
jgi:phosphoribosylformylglycinamidine cyclo-ligase